MKITIAVSCPGFNYEVFRRELIEHSVEIIDEQKTLENWILQLSVDESQLTWIKSLEEEGIEIISDVTEVFGDLKEYI